MQLVYFRSQIIKFLLWSKKKKTIEAGAEVLKHLKCQRTERLKKRFADREFNSDEDWDNAAEEAYAEDEESINVFQGQQQNH